MDDILKDYYIGEALRSPVRLDGNTDEWSREWLVAEPAAGRAQDQGDDLVGVWAVQDERYVYIRCDFAEEPQGTTEIVIDTNADGQEDYRIHLYRKAESWGGSPEENWEGWTFDRSNWGIRHGFADVARAGNSLEVRLHKRFVGEVNPIHLLAVNEYPSDWRHARWTSTEDQVSGFFPVPDASDAGAE